MRTLIPAAAAALTMGASAPAAQAPVITQAGSPAVATPPAAAPLGPPRGFVGYAQPDIGASACKMVNPGQTTCTIPAMTAGRYLIEASGTSTANGPNPVQRIAIVVGATNCGQAERKPTAKAPWTPGTAKTLRLQCEVEIISDRPLPVHAVYADDKATKAATGPTLTVRRLPWDGVISTKVAAPPQD